MTKKHMIDFKKERERKFLNEVAQIYPMFPKGKITNSESPDFLIEQDAKITGIEIVDYVRGQNKGESVVRRNEVLRERVAITAQEVYETKYNIPLLVHILWKQRYFLRQSEITKLANEAANLIENHIPKQLFDETRISSVELDGTLLKNVCHSITITRMRNEKQSLWYPISSGWIEVQTDEIQHLIDAKNTKVQEYSRQCDAIWLIIVADGHYISSNIDLPEEVTRNIYTCLFEQVLIYDRIGKSVFQLRLQLA